MEIGKATTAEEFDACIEYASQDIVKNLLLLADMYHPYREHSDVYYVMENGKVVGLAIGFPLFPIYDINVEADTPEVERSLLVHSSQGIFPPILTLADLDQLAHLESMSGVLEVVKVWRELHMVLGEFNPLPTEQVPKRANPDDLERLRQFYEKNPVEAFLSEQIAAGPCYYIEVDGMVQSAAGVHFETPEMGHLGNIMTAPAHRKKGLGTACIQAVIEELLSRNKLVSLFVYPDNGSAIRLYERMGFEVAREVYFVEWTPAGDAAKPIPGAAEDATEN